MPGGICNFYLLQKYKQWKSYFNRTLEDCKITGWHLSLQPGNEFPAT